MNGIEIKTRLTEIQKELDDVLMKFVLTDRVRELIAESRKLKAECEHNFVDGVCEYCGSKENDE